MADPAVPDPNRCRTMQNAYDMQQQRLEIFMSQDTDRGKFDVSFEVEGRTILANKIFLISASDYFGALFADRWNPSQNYKISAHSYDNFFQMLCFFYAGCCEVSLKNAKDLVQMADYYQVPIFKNFCDEYFAEEFSKGSYNFEAFEEYWELANDCMLPKFSAAIKSKIHDVSLNYEKESFLNLNDSQVVLFLSYGRLYAKNPIMALYDWCEHRVETTMPCPTENDADDGEAAKNERASAKKKQIVQEMLELLNLMDKSDLVYSHYFDVFASKDILSSEFLQMAFNSHRCDTKEKTFFKKAYIFARKIASEKRKSKKNYKVKDAVKAELEPIYSGIWKLDKKFVNDAIIKRGLLTQEEVDRRCRVQIECQNSHGKLIGEFVDTFGIASLHINRRPYDGMCNDRTQRFMHLKVNPPTTPSTVSKMKGNEWYLALDDGFLCLKQDTMIKPEDYLIAEMKPEEKFKLAHEHTKIQIRALDSVI